MGNIIEVKDLRKTYKSRGRMTEALRGISFSVKRGEIFGLLGPNGAGKSTTLNILIGLLSSTGGKIQIFGKDFARNEEYIKSRMNIATAYADLATALTVYQNLKVFAVMYNVENYREKIEALCGQFDIRHLYRSKFGELSAGQKTRVNLCNALLNDP